MADKKYSVRLKGHVGFPGVHIPGTNIMITKDPVVMMEAERDAILKAIRREHVSLIRSDVEIKVSRSLAAPTASARFVPARRRNVSGGTGLV